MLGGFLLIFFSFFVMGIPTSCFILFTGFRTVFFFALKRFVPVVVNLFDLARDMAGKIEEEKKLFWP